ncbi:MAG: type II secretion system protein GspE [Candidatus Marinimicrobia bacterium]|nr:type II secretion system protein GspE [Candidatus Neomarinimicrobiota bacterium]
MKTEFKKTAQAMTINLGEFLVQEYLITEEQLEEALVYKDETRCRFGDACVRLGFIDQNTLTDMLSRQLRIPRVELEYYEIDSDILDFVDKDLVSELNMLPLYRIDNELVVSTDDPLNVSIIDSMQRSTKLKVMTAISTKEEIQKAIQSYFAIYTSASDLDEQPIQEESNESLELTEEEAEKIVNVADRILKDSVELGASDIHIEQKEKNIRVRLRVDGMLQKYRELPKSHASPLISRYKVLSGIDIAETRKPQDGRFKYQINKVRSVDLRVSTYPAAHGEKVVMRILDEARGKIPLDRLGFSKNVLESWQKSCSLPNGIVLVTGPTGSGKSTTLYATLNIMNTIEKNIITIEDPIEYKLDGIIQAQVNEKAEMTFAAALRSMLRQDPDIIMVGEMRDRETISLAIRAALTGHLVFSTLHTNDAVSSYTRLIDMGTDPFLLSSSIRAILAQRLLRVLCTKCKIEYEPLEKELNSINMKKPETLIYKKSNKKNCKNCRGTGYRGRIGLYELLVPSQEINLMITEGANDIQIQKAASEKGMKRLTDEGQDMILKGITSIEELNRVL